MRYFLHISYDGGSFRGWQRQSNVSSVQEVLEEKLSKVLKEEVVVYGCGRTDAGVHASQYMLHINLVSVPDFDLKFILNKNLPDAIVVHDVIEVEDRQHARYDAKVRSYDYFIHFENDPVLNKYSSLYELEGLDYDKMIKAAKLFEGNKDFRRFCKQPDIHNHTECNVMSAVLLLSKNKKRMHFSITANRFLKGMIRIIVNSLLAVGKGELSIELLREMLDDEGELEAVKPALPNGLYLSKIEYPFLSIPEKEGITTFLKSGY